MISIFMILIIIYGIKFNVIINCININDIINNNSPKWVKINNTIPLLWPFNVV